MVSAVVLAGGSGSRMNSKVAKQFIEIAGKPLIYYALKCFEDSVVDEVIFVTREEDIEYCKSEIINKYGFKKVKKIVAGGKNRYDSVYNGIVATDDNCDIVMIHDGARPFITDRMIKDSIAEAREYSAVTVAVPVKDTIKIVDENGFSVSTPDRRTLYQIQTPQTFKKEMLVQAYNIMYESGDTDITDDTMIIERYINKKVKIIEGSYTNIKVTTSEDIDVAEAITTR